MDVTLLAQELLPNDAAPNEAWLKVFSDYGVAIAIVIFLMFFVTPVFVAFAWAICRWLAKKGDVLMTIHEKFLDRTSAAIEQMPGNQLATNELIEAQAQNISNHEHMTHKAMARQADAIQALAEAHGFGDKTREHTQAIKEAVRD